MSAAKECHHWIFLCFSGRVGDEGEGKDAGTTMQFFLRGEDLGMKTILFFFPSSPSLQLSYVKWSQNQGCNYNTEGKDHS